MSSKSPRFDWWSLGRTGPLDLVRARILAHHAIQWPARAARANLATRPDDSHSSLEWDAQHSALVTQPLRTPAGDVRIGLRVGALALVVVRHGAVLDVLQLNGKPDPVAGVWIDAKLQALGLRPASGIKIPYEIPDHPVAGGARYDLYMLERELGELARWFGAAAATLESVKAKLADLHPGPSPVLCRPNHFDIATVVSLDDERAIRIGLSPGDGYYPQPYVYVSPSPPLESTRLPEPPHPGHWRTEGFFGAVATGEDILGLENRGRGLFNFIMRAVEIGRAHVSREPGEATGTLA